MSIKTEEVEDFLKPQIKVIKDRYIIFDSPQAADDFCFKYNEMNPSLTSEYRPHVVIEYYPDDTGVDWSKPDSKYLVERTVYVRMCLPNTPKHINNLRDWIEKYQKNIIGLQTDA